MNTAIVTLKSLTPYSQSRAHEIPRDKNESHDEHDERTWREHLHYLPAPDERVFIPAAAFHNAKTDAAQFAGLKIPGEGQSKFTKNFTAGVGVTKDLVLPIKKSAVGCERLYLNSDGKRGGGKRVWRRFPVIHEWGGTIEYMILDDKITKDVFAQVMEVCGALIGIGRFRPIKGGWYGRFQVTKLKWE